MITVRSRKDGMIATRSGKRGMVNWKTGTSCEGAEGTETDKLCAEVEASCTGSLMAPEDASAQTIYLTVKLRRNSSERE